MEISSMIIAVRAVFQKNKKYYPQVFLDKDLHKLWIIQKCYIRIEPMFLNEPILIKQMYQMSVIFVTIGIS